MDTLREENDGPRPEAGTPLAGETPPAAAERVNQAPADQSIPSSLPAESPEAVSGDEAEVDEPELSEAEAEEAESDHSGYGSRRARRDHGFRLGLGAGILLALVMFLLGGAAGYFGRPIISPEPTPQDPQAAFLATVISKVRHFQGNPNAPVTMIEFSDYQ